MMEDPLAALRPLHAPPPVGWWPPAPGWWLIVVLFAAVIYWLYRYWQRMAPKRVALQELKRLEKNQDTVDQPVAVLNQLLKRYALVCWPAEEVASLSGRAWLEFLDTHGGDGKFSQEGGQQLITAPYQQQSTEMNELTMLTELVRRWIKANTPRNK